LVVLRRRHETDCCGRERRPAPIGGYCSRTVPFDHHRLHAYLVAATDGIDHAEVIGNGGQAIYPGLVVQTPVDAAQTIVGHHTLERLVHGIAAAQVEEIHRHPHFGGRGLTDALHHL
jgi:hypothetical protein